MEAESEDEIYPARPTSRSVTSLRKSNRANAAARTGKLVWHYQEVPHDLWNYDAASPVVIFDVHVKGKTIHAVGEAGKRGYFFILDARTGKRLFPPLAFVKEHDTPPTTKPTLQCPGVVGGSLYSPVAYSPLTHAAYISGINVCFIVKLTKKVEGVRGISRGRAHPGRCGRARSRPST